MQRLLRRGDTDEAVRVAAPCHRLPSANSRSGRPANTSGQSSRSHARHRSGKRARWRAPRCGQSRLRVPSGWPVRKGPWHRARGLRSGRSPPRPARRGFRNSPGNSPPRSRAVGGARSEPRHAAVAGRPLRTRRMLLGRVHRRSDTLPFRTLTAMSTAAVAPSMRHQGRPHSRRQRSAPAACGSSTSPRPAQDPGYRTNDIPSEARQTLIVKATEIRGRAAERPNEPELRGDGVNGKTKPHLLRKRETTLGFALHLIEWIARRKKVRVQVAAAVRRKSEVTDPVCSLESPTQQIAASPDMSRPGRDYTSKVQIDPGLEALQPALFDQFIAEPAESKSGLVVAEARSGE